jgi:SAM-dependent methyltransferase
MGESSSDRTDAGQDPAEPVAVTIASDESFRIDDVEFVIDVPPKRPSQPNSFSLSKSGPFIRFYEALTAEMSPDGVLELGIFQGGSYVFLDKLFVPKYLSAIDVSEPVEPLEQYVAGREDRYAHFGTSQTDEAALRQIVESELHGQLDLVIDDASHQYQPTKRSFEILYPMLRPGGAYVIEDWSWAHVPQNQGDDAWLSDEAALTNLLIDQLLLLGSTLAIAEIRVLRFLYMIRKPMQPLELATDDLWDGILNRGRKQDRI